MVNRTFRSLGADSMAWSHQKNSAHIFTHFAVEIIKILQVDLHSATKQAFSISWTYFNFCIR